MTSGVESNNWAVSFASAGGNVLERDDLDFVFEFTGDNNTGYLDLNGFLFTADGDSGVTVTIVASGGSDAATGSRRCRSISPFRLVQPISISLMLSPHYVAANALVR